MAENHPFGDLIEKIGPGTAAGAAVGGLGALVLSLFMGRGEGKEGPGFLTSLLTIGAGILLGGAAGGYMKKDGPIFTPKDKGGDAPDGTAVVKRKLGMDEPPKGAANVELDYAATLREMMAKSPAVEGMQAVDRMLQLVGDRYRLLLKSGGENEKGVSFTGIGLAVGKGGNFIPFEKPVEVPVKDGKVDYALAGALSGMRLAEQAKFALYVELRDAEGLKKKYGERQLDSRDKKRLQTELALSALAANGSLSGELVKKIGKEAVGADHRLNGKFLEENKTALGLNEKRALMFAPDGDHFNLAFGLPKSGEVSIQQVMRVDVKKIAEALRSGQVPKALDVMFNPGDLNGLNLETLGVLNDAKNMGLTYRKLSAPNQVKIIKEASAPGQGGKLDIEEFNATIRKAAGEPHSPETRRNTKASPSVSQAGGANAEALKPNVAFRMPLGREGALSV